MASGARSVESARPPETDWLTGLRSRAAFGRQVTQVDRDRDRFSIALIEIEDFGEVNRRLDYEAGDDLLRELGRGLADHASVETSVARLGGAQFAVLAVHPDGTDLRQWVAPLLAAARSAIAEWTFDLIDFTGECPIEPRLRAGLASGRGGVVWGQAAIALELAQSDPRGEPVVIHDERDPRIAARARRRDLADRVTDALAGETLTVMARRIEAVSGPEPDWDWLELAAVEPPDGTDNRSADGRPRLLDGSALPAGLGRRLDDWLIDRAGRMLSAAGRQVRLTVAATGCSLVDRNLSRRISAAVERYRIPPSRLLLEVGESVLVRDPGPGRALARRLDGIGSGLTVGRCTGGWPAWQELEGLPIAYIKPDQRLVDRATQADPAANVILRSIIDNAVCIDRQLIAPPSTTGSDLLGQLGFAYRTQATTDGPILDSEPVG